MHDPHSDLLRQILDEQRRTNDLLLELKKKLQSGLEQQDAVSVDVAAKMLRVGRKRATAYIREGRLRLLGGNPGKRQRLPFNSQVLTTSIREMLEIKAVPSS